ncbi:hypothetical protein CPB83DRAFT_895496, partial [Crepidotus variabilis]
TRASSTERGSPKLSSVSKPITPARPYLRRTQHQVPTPEEYSKLPLEEKLNQLYTQGFHQMKASMPESSKFYKPSQSGFKEPRKRVRRGEDKNKALEWVRESINILLGIKSTSELLTHNDIFPKDTPLQQHMRNFDAHLHRSPAIKPMKVHWESIHSVWNEVLFEEFKKLSIDEGEMLELDEEQELYDMFFARLKRMRADLWAKRPV